MIDVHNVGKKDTKYMSFQKNCAPLLDRSACSTRRDFVALPLGDNVINSELAESFKNGFRGDAAGVDVSAKAESSYKGEFVSFSPDRSKAAKPKSFKPKQSRTMTITGMTDLLETRPSSHVSHSAPNAALAKAAETVLAKPNITLGSTWGQPPKTSYSQEFRGLRPSPSAPEVGQLGGREDERPSVLLPASHPSFTTRRVLYMSPGQ